ncbi:hypothetical protein KO02_16265 [Sphingobacterium sp. ML3W]|uniref:hypothetical protein n=1 Tax=Sphingobacterium sp. ML3W TaxID=1538644 RepID=UPI0004F91F56|nr:hypothetical protein [Sphingobacterium sp. ML3W]AIM38065.1 hypothetical protein KO02_16265 [Sphingobacterium sp. ML3W]
MKKIKFKINQHQLKVWIACLELGWREPSNEAPAIVRMVFHALSKLIHKLKLEDIMNKAEYNFSIDSVEGLAFIAHMQGYGTYLVSETDATVINGIIGIIDSKTK